MNYSDVVRALSLLSNTQKAFLYRRFFKTGRGEYGEGDQFLGITVPQQRKVVKKFSELSLQDIDKLLKSPFHEHRFTALQILVWQYQKGNKKTQERLYKYYLKNAKRVNNWDLVDTSTPQIVGAWLYDWGKKNEWQKTLLSLSKSKNLWERRIAVLATFYFIRKQVYTPALQIAVQLLRDQHDLIHKAVGWMLREVGKRDEKILRDFLDKHAIIMPRTMLRYAIERLSVSVQNMYKIKKKKDTRTQTMIK